MSKRRVTAIIAAIIISAALVSSGCIGGYQLIQYEKQQNETITELRNEVSGLRSELDQLIELTKEEEKYSDTAFNYLAVGNSITIHGLADYWWNEIGMAASTEDKDFVHRVAAYLEETYGEVCFYAFNYSVWESQALDRAETFNQVDEYLDEQLDLVTVQLSENVRNMDTYEADYEELIRHIQEKAPDAQIIVIDEFWDGADKSILKEQAANRTGVQFVSLSEIRENPEYRCGIGTVVYGAGGEEHTVEHNGVADHPGDKGMEYIADAVIRLLQ